MKNAVKDKIRGLTDEEARLSRERHGANTLAEVKHKSFLRAFLENLGDPETATSTATIEMETFFATAKDADVIIYNSAIVGEVESIEELIGINGLLAEFKAVQTGNVWCTSQNMYQETTQLGQMIQSFHTIFSGEADGLDEVPYLTRLR